MGLFRSREAEDLAAVQVKLEAARADVETQEQFVRELALEVALTEGDTPPRMVEAQDKLRRLQDRVHLLQAAVEEARRLEASRLARARGEAEKARVRALRQHLSAVEKAALDYQVAAENLAAAWSRMDTSAR